MNRKLRKLHPKEILGSEGETVVLTLKSSKATQLIQRIVSLVTNVKTKSRNVRFPSDQKTGRIIEFQPQVIRKDLDGGTVTIFGLKDSDETRFLYQVRFSSGWKRGQYVRFEITEFFNCKNPTLIPMLY